MFQKATRTKAKLKLAITGPSGSGKTYSALLLAAGMGKKIAVIDTENGSASLYADTPGMPPFDVLELTPPYLSSKYQEAIKRAAAAGYDVLVIDSISHQWNGEGGILDRKEKEQMAKPSMNSYTLWAKYTPEHEVFKSTINNAPIHVICTMRSKQEYVLEQNEKGKQTPRKVGMAPIQRDGSEYDHTIVFDLAINHYASVSKDRTGLFDGQHFILSAETGKQILDWCNSGKEQASSPAVSPPSNAEVKVGGDFSRENGAHIQTSVSPTLSIPHETKLVIAAMKKFDWTSAQVVEWMTARFNKKTLKELSEAELAKLLQVLEIQNHANAMQTAKVLKPVNEGDAAL